MSRTPGTAARRSVGLCLFFTLLSGAAVGGPQLKSVSQLQKDCEGGEARACYDLGVLYTDGRGVAKDRRRAAELFKQVCSGGVAQGCTMLGMFLLEGIGVPKDERRGADLLEQACKSG